MEANSRKPRPAKPPESRHEGRSSKDDQASWRNKSSGPTRAAPEVVIEIPGRDVTSRRVRFEEAMADREKKAREEPVVEKPLELPYIEVPPARHGAAVEEINEEVDVPPPARDEKAYRVRAPIQKDGIDAKVVNKMLDDDVTLKKRDIYAIAPGVRELMKAKLTKVRQPLYTPKPKEVMMVEEEVELPFEDEEDDSCLDPDAIPMEELPQVQSVFITTGEYDNFPAGSIMVPDPYMQYLETLGKNEAPKKVYVARDSASLRVVFPMVNKQGYVESVTDSGSQIVSMSLAQAMRSKVHWDPDIQIYMQSANGSLEKSVGLAKNVGFTFGDLTFYLQVHIIRGAAYDILLGRPFEILAESQVQNHSDGTQTMTLRDPNTGRRCMLPSHPRSKKPTSETTPSVPQTQRRATVESVPDEEDLQPEEPVVEHQGFHHSSKI